MESFCLRAEPRPSLSCVPTHLSVWYGMARLHKARQPSLYSGRGLGDRQPSFPEDGVPRETSKLSAKNAAKPVARTAVSCEPSAATCAYGGRSELAYSMATTGEGKEDCGNVSDEPDARDWQLPLRDVSRETAARGFAIRRMQIHVTGCRAGADTWTSVISTKCSPP